MKVKVWIEDDFEYQNQSEGFKEDAAKVDCILREIKKRVGDDEGRITIEWNYPVLPRIGECIHCNATELWDSEFKKIIELSSFVLKIKALYWSNTNGEIIPEIVYTTEF